MTGTWQEKIGDWPEEKKRRLKRQPPSTPRGSGQSPILFRHFPVQFDYSFTYCPTPFFFSFFFKKKPVLLRDNPNAIHFVLTQFETTVECSFLLTLTLFYTPLSRIVPFCTRQIPHHHDWDRELNEKKLNWRGGAAEAQCQRYNKHSTKELNGLSDASWMRWN